MADQKFKNICMFIKLSVLRLLGSWNPNSVIRFGFNDLKNLKNKIIKWIWRICFFSLFVKINVTFTLKLILDYFMHILFILEPTIAIFHF